MSEIKLAPGSVIVEVAANCGQNLNSLGLRAEAHERIGALIITSPKLTRELTNTIADIKNTSSLPLIYKQTSTKNSLPPYEEQISDLIYFGVSTKVDGVIIQTCPDNRIEPGLVRCIQSYGMEVILDANLLDQVDAPQPLKAIDEGLSAGVRNIVYTPRHLKSFGKFLKDMEAPEDCRFLVDYTQLMSAPNAVNQPQTSLNARIGRPWNYIVHTGVFLR